MLELIALLLYGTQWLGVALGVGAQTVILIAHLLMLHEHKHPWLAYVPGARGAQSLGLFLMAASGVGAVAVHMFAGSAATLLQPAFGFKWMLIVLLWAAYRLERPHEGVWQGTIEAFAGATWYALFLVHTLAPITSWANLFVLYILWLASFGAIWGTFAGLMSYAGKRSKALQPEEEINTPIYRSISAPEPVKKIAQKAVLPPPPPPKPAPVIKTPAPKPVIASASVPAKPKGPSLWSRIKHLFTRMPKPAAPEPSKVAAPFPPTPKPVQAPALHKEEPKPQAIPAGYIPSTANWPLKRDPQPPAAHPNLPVPVRLEIVGPTTPITKPAPAAKPPMPQKKKEPSIDYRDLPAIQIMPQKPEEVATRNRGPVINLEDSVELNSKTVADAMRDL